MKLIKLQDKFILVSDEDAKNNEFLYNLENNTICRAMGNAEVSHFKIIAGVEFLPSIDFSLLKEEDCKTIGYVDVEKLALNLDKSKCRNFKREYTSTETYEGIVDGFIEGFKTNQSLNNKQFSLEDIEKAWKAGMEFIGEDKGDYDKLLQSLQQTSWDVEVDMEYQDMHGMWFTKPTILSELDRPSRPKITNDKIKVTKIL